MNGRAYLKHEYLGFIEITEENNKISGINFVEKNDKEEIYSKETAKCKKELLEYFEGKRTKFSVKIDFVKGTEFQKSCWDAMYQIPFGKTITYSEEANAINNPKAVRAVGGANGKNPISIIVP